MTHGQSDKPSYRDAWTLGQIYAPPTQKMWRVPKKIIYRDTIEIEKGHQNSHQHESLIAHKLFLGEGSLR